MAMDLAGDMEETKTKSRKERKKEVKNEREKTDI
jgi:hypothetical protein